VSKKSEQKKVKKRKNNGGLATTRFFFHVVIVMFFVSRHFFRITCKQLFKVVYHAKWLNNFPKEINRFFGFLF